MEETRRPSVAYFVSVAPKVFDVREASQQNTSLLCKDEKLILGGISRALEPFKKIGLYV